MPAGSFCARDVVSYARRTSSDGRQRGQKVTYHAKGNYGQDPLDQKRSEQLDENRRDLVYFYWTDAQPVQVVVSVVAWRRQVVQQLGHGELRQDVPIPDETSHQGHQHNL